MKLKLLGITLLLILIDFNNLFAQGNPCDDPDLGCPIDTWVIALAAVTLLVTTWYLYRKQQQARKMA